MTETSSTSTMESPPNGKSTASVVLFDGVCNVCNATVNFIIDRDPQARFHFASLQSPEGIALAAAHGVDATEMSTVVLIDDGRAYTKSTALLRVARRLNGPWPLAYAAVVVPRAVRDLAYRFLVANRYRWFGKSETCRVPTPEMRSRFLSA